MRVRELVGYLVSMASLQDEEMARKFADELDKLLPRDSNAMEPEYWLQLRQPSAWGGMDRIRMNFGIGKDNRKEVVKILRQGILNYVEITTQDLEIDKNGHRRIRQ